MISYSNYKVEKVKFYKSIIFLFFAFIILFHSFDLRHFINSELQRFQSNHASFSGLIELVDEGEESELFSDLSTAKKVLLLKKLLYISIRDMINPVISNASDVSLVINFRNLQKIYSDREEALKFGLLISSHEVPCQIKFLGNSYQCTARLKGDLSDHWYSKERLSLRVKLKNGFVFGMNDFSIQKPRSRQYPYDYAFQEIIAKLNGIASNKQKVIKLSINGDSWGLMSLEEAVGDKFLERRSEKVSSIFRISDQKIWRYQAQEDIFEDYFVSSPQVTLGIKGSDKQFFDSSLNRAVYGSILNSLISKDGSIFDRNSMLNNLFMAMAWGSMHTLYNSNTSYYWNNYTQKLEPVSSDQQFWTSLSEKSIVKLIKDLPYEYKIMFAGVPLTMSEADMHISNVQKASKDVLQLINDNKKLYYPDDSLFTNSPIQSNVIFLRSNLLKILAIINDEDSRSTLVRNSSKLPSKEQLSFMGDFVRAIHFENGDLILANLVGAEVTIKSVIFGGDVFLINEKLDKSTSDNLAIKRISTPFKGYLDSKILVETEINGVVKKSLASYTLPIEQLNQSAGGGLIYCSDAEFARCNINKSIKSSNDIIFDEHVILGPKTRINLVKGASIIFRKGVTINGSAINPVVIKSDNTGGVVIINQKVGGQSSLRNVVFSNLSEVRSGLRAYSGAINAYGGDFLFRNVSIIGGKAEDQLNIVKANVSIDNMNISDAVSDGLDCDYCTGNIKKLNVVNIGGDGLDVSGSNLEVIDFSAVGVKDKAISVGEFSFLLADAAFVRNAATGIAVKDSSKVVIDSITMEGISNDAFMTYNKKLYMEGVTKLTVNNYDINGSYDNLCVRNRGTELKIAGVQCTETQVDVKGLYLNRMRKQ
jgi:hypothetical protein